MSSHVVRSKAYWSQWKTTHWLQWALDQSHNGWLSPKSWAVSKPAEPISHQNDQKLGRYVHLSNLQIPPFFSLPWQLFSWKCWKFCWFFPCTLHRVVACSGPDLPMQLKDSSCRQNREQPSPLILFMSSHSSPSSLQAGHTTSKKQSAGKVASTPMVCATPLKNLKILRSCSVTLCANPENTSPFLLKGELSSFLVHRLAWPVPFCTCGYHLLFPDEDMSNFLHSWWGCSSAGGEKENRNLWNSLY